MLVTTTLGYQLVLPKGFQKWPSRSWSMKRPTRVPASSTVKMKSASNMMAKWYQMASRPAIPSVREKMWAMPTASDGAPPVRLKSVISPTRLARSDIASGVSGKPQPEIVFAACSGIAPTMPAGLFIAK